MIKIRDKDAMLIIANLIMFFSALSWYTLDFVAYAAQLMASLKFENMLLAYTLMRGFGGISIGVAAVLTIGLDCWFIYRIFAESRRQYWRDNL